MTDTDTTAPALTPQEEDCLRHAFAVGTIALRSVSDIATVGVIEDRPMTSAELRLIEQRLLEAFDVLYSVTESEVGRDFPLEPPDSEDARDRFQDNYSYGTPVVTIARTAD